MLFKRRLGKEWVNTVLFRCNYYTEESLADLVYTLRDFGILNHKETLKARDLIYSDKSLEYISKITLKVAPKETCFGMTRKDNKYCFGFFTKEEMAI